MSSGRVTGRRGRKIYLASSWRNDRQPAVVRRLREEGHEVNDFRDNEDHFAWSDIDPDYERWDAGAFSAALGHELAVRGFNNDFSAMQWANAFVLALPSGRSAHIEAGWAIGRGIPTGILIEGDTYEPELMYKMADCITPDIDVIVEWLTNLSGGCLYER